MDSIFAQLIIPKLNQEDILSLRLSSPMGRNLVNLSKPHIAIKVLSCARKKNLNVSFLGWLSGTRLIIIDKFGRGQVKKILPNLGKIIGIKIRWLAAIDREVLLALKGAQEVTFSACRFVDNGDLMILQGGPRRIVFNWSSINDYGLSYLHGLQELEIKGGKYITNGGLRFLKGAKKVTLACCQGLDVGQLRADLGPQCEIWVAKGRKDRPIMIP